MSIIILDKERRYKQSDYKIRKENAIKELKKFLNEYAEKGILFICEIDDVYEPNETHILHDYLIVDVYRDDD